MNSPKNNFTHQKIPGYKWVWGIIAGLITMSYYPVPGIIIFCIGLIMSVKILNSKENKSGRLFNKGLHIYKKGFFDMAIQLWEEAVKKDGENIFAHRALCIMYHDHEKNPALALAHGKKVLSLDPADHQTAFKVGEILFEMGEFDQAAAVLKSIGSQGELSEATAQLLKKINSRKKN